MQRQPAAWWPAIGAAAAGLYAALLLLGLRLIWALGVPHWLPSGSWPWSGLWNLMTFSLLAVSCALPVLLMLRMVALMLPRPARPRLERGQGTGRTRVTERQEGTGFPALPWWRERQGVFSPRSDRAPPDACRARPATDA